MNYPATRTGSDVELVAGVGAPDPFRWLEDDDDPDVLAWQRAQAKLAAELVAELPGHDMVHALVDTYLHDRFASAPRSAGGLSFSADLVQGSPFPRITVAGELGGQSRVLLDVAALSHDSPSPVIAWLAPSPDAHTLAVGICPDGSEHNFVLLIDVASTSVTRLPGVTLHDAMTGGVAWLPDSSGFFVTALVGPPVDFEQAVFRYDVNNGTLAREEIFGCATNDYTLIQVSRDGRWAVAVHGIMAPRPVALLDLTHPDSQWRPFIRDVDGWVAGHVIGDDYVALTDVDAPRGRVVAIPLSSAHPDKVSQWRELVPESDVVLRSVTPIAQTLYLVGLEHTYARLTTVDLATGRLTELQLPGHGAISFPPFPLMTVVAAPHAAEFRFAYSSFGSSWASYRHRPGESAIELLVPPAIDIEGLEVLELHATSADGTLVPYQLVRRVDGPVDAPQPAVIYAYGGYNVPWVPQYHTTGAVTLAAGATYIYPHLRGGGEYGADWWRAGRMRNKQRCYDDLFAVAEDVVGRRFTTHDQLGLVGGSNGGHLCGVAIVQRPQYWKAVVPRVPILDLIGATRTAYGRFAAEAELADLSDRGAVEALLRISPYHQVMPGDYPAVLIDAGSTDPRCRPSHARKFAARLQAGQRGERPILLHVWDNVGHGWATARDLAVEENAEWLSFLLHEIGVR